LLNLQTQLAELSEDHCEAILFDSDLQEELAALEGEIKLEDAREGIKRAFDDICQQSDWSEAKGQFKDLCDDLRKPLDRSMQTDFDNALRDAGYERVLFLLEALVRARPSDLGSILNDLERLPNVPPEAVVRAQAFVQDKENNAIREAEACLAKLDYPTVPDRTRDIDNCLTSLGALSGSSVSDLITKLEEHKDFWRSWENGEIDQRGLGWIDQARNAGINLACDEFNAVWADLFSKWADVLQQNEQSIAEIKDLKGRIEAQKQQTVTQLNHMQAEFEQRFARLEYTVMPRSAASDVFVDDTTPDQRHLHEVGAIPASKDDPVDETTLAKPPESEGQEAQSSRPARGGLFFWLGRRKQPEVPADKYLYERVDELETEVDALESKLSSSRRMVMVLWVLLVMMIVAALVFGIRFPESDDTPDEMAGAGTQDTPTPVASATPEGMPGDNDGVQPITTLTEPLTDTPPDEDTVDPTVFPTNTFVPALTVTPEPTEPAAQPVITRTGEDPITVVADGNTEYALIFTLEHVPENAVLIVSMNPLGGNWGRVIDQPARTDAQVAVSYRAGTQEGIVHVSLCASILEDDIAPNRVCSDPVEIQLVREPVALTVNPVDDLGAPMAHEEPVLLRPGDTQIFEVHLTREDGQSVQGQYNVRVNIPDDRPGMTVASVDITGTNQEVMLNISAGAPSATFTISVDQTVDAAGEREVQVGIPGREDASLTSVSLQVLLDLAAIAPFSPSDGWIPSAGLLVEPDRDAGESSTVTFVTRLTLKPTLDAAVNYPVQIGCEILYPTDPAIPAGVLMVNDEEYLCDGTTWETTTDDFGFLNLNLEAVVGLGLVRLFVQDGAPAGEEVLTEELIFPVGHRTSALLLPAGEDMTALNRETWQTTYAIAVDDNEGVFFGFKYVTGRYRREYKVFVLTGLDEIPIRVLAPFSVPEAHVQNEALVYSTEGFVGYQDVWGNDAIPFIPAGTWLQYLPSYSPYMLFMLPEGVTQVTGIKFVDMRLNAPVEYTEETINLRLGYVSGTIPASALADAP
ncbi:MAG: hypothetical protein K8S97_04025, partial [Anaerolineae bacterium]|nr:hypothetical protein [Anaerolineae bacterium]